MDGNSMTRYDDVKGLETKTSPIDNKNEIEDKTMKHVKANRSLLKTVDHAIKRQLPN